MLALAYAGARLPGPFAVLDNLSNFPFHFAAALLACAAALALRGRRLAALAAAAVALLPISQVAPWYVGREPATPGGTGTPVKLLVSNVYYNNGQHDRIQRLIAREDPDVVGLIEINADWLRSLGELRRRYPHYYEIPEERFVGLGLYSRLPLEDARTLRMPNSGMPAIAATLAMPGKDIEIILVHLPPPLNASLVRRRNSQAAKLARHVLALGEPTVVAGDFNLSMWNRGYRPLETIARLVNARAGHGVGPTWPALWRLGVPIDHILATPAVKLTGFKVHDAIGSDHLPVSASLEVVASE